MNTDNSTGYEHLPTVADLEEIIGWMTSAEPENDDHARELAEDIEMAKLEISRRSNVPFAPGHDAATLKEFCA